MNKKKEENKFNSADAELQLNKIDQFLNEILREWFKQ